MIFWRQSLPLWQDGVVCPIDRRPCRARLVGWCRSWCLTAIRKETSQRMRRGNHTVGRFVKELSPLIGGEEGLFSLDKSPLLVVTSNNNSERFIRSAYVAEWEMAHGRWDIRSWFQFIFPHDSCLLHLDSQFDSSKPIISHVFLGRPLLSHQLCWQVPHRDSASFFPAKYTQSKSYSTRE